MAPPERATRAHPTRSTHAAGFAAPLSPPTPLLERGTGLFGTQRRLTLSTAQPCR